MPSMGFVPFPTRVHPLRLLANESVSWRVFGALPVQIGLSHPLSLIAKVVGLGVPGTDDGRALANGSGWLLGLRCEQTLALVRGDCFGASGCMLGVLGMMIYALLDVQGSSLA